MIEAVAERVRGVLDAPLYWFPVRHHSPAVAGHLRAVIRERRPKLILLEGPSEAGHLIEHVVDKRTRPPVAIYTSFRAGERQAASWYPLVAYSPEYVAMKTAKAVGARVEFIDLPFYAQSGWAPEAEVETEGDEDGDVSEEPSDPIQASEFYRELTRAAGYRSWNEAWDTLFELPERDAGEFRHELAAFCAAARATAAECADSRLRERFMMARIRAALEAHAPDELMVVCGGYHLFLDPDDADSVPEIPDGELRTALVPYSFLRIAEQTGYGAGNRAPAFYQRAFGLDADALLAEHVVEVLRRARRLGEPVSPADAIAVTQHARLLARLRGRSGPVLDDMHDALVACCVKGDPDVEGRPLRVAMDRVAVGVALGRVSPDSGVLPIVHDFHGRVRAHGLDELLAAETTITRDLDRRDAGDGACSAFLHRLLFLGLEVGEATDASLGGSLFRERWRLRWSPRLEARLVEQSLRGDTVEAAALNRLGERLADAARDARAACGLLVTVVDMDLPELVAHAETVCGDAIDSDARFAALAAALGSLLVLDRYAQHRRLSRTALSGLIERCFARACFAVPEIVAAPAEQHEDIVDAFRTLSEAALRRDDLDRDLFTAHVRSAAGLCEVPFLRGAMIGILVETRQAEVDLLAEEFERYAAGPADETARAGEFLDGALAASRAAVQLGAEPLVRAVDRVLGAASWDAFLIMLPRLRAAFERLHARQRDAVAGRVAALLGLGDAENLKELRTSVEAASVLARIDAEVAGVLAEWDL